MRYAGLRYVGLLENDPDGEHKLSLRLAEDGEDGQVIYHEIGIDEVPVPGHRPSTPPRSEILAEPAPCAVPVPDTAKIDAEDTEFAPSAAPRQRPPFVRQDAVDERETPQVSSATGALTDMEDVVQRVELERLLPLHHGMMVYGAKDGDISVPEALQTSGGALLVRATGTSHIEGSVGLNEIDVFQTLNARVETTNKLLMELRDDQKGLHDTFIKLIDELFKIQSAPAP